MKRSEHLEHAKQADRLAMASDSPEERTAYERIASVWRELAATGAAAADGEAVSAPAEATTPPAKATPP